VAELNKPDTDPSELVRLADVMRAVRSEIGSSKAGQNYLVKGVIDVTRAGVTFNGEVIDNALSARLMDIMATGLRIGPWVRFAENVYQNPAEYARDELYEWLAKSDLPITDDGHFLAYKVVREDYTDVYTGTFDNSVGKIVQLTGRDQVDPDRHNLCSTGLHFCSKEYLTFFGANGSGRKVLIVKINPADVVSIPTDYNFAKGRTWRYEVVDEIAHEEINGRTWDPVNFDYSDDDYSDYDDEYDDEYDDDDYDDEEVDEDVTDKFPEVDDAQRFQDFLDSYSIVQLRPMASQAGLNSTLAWKVYSKPQLVRYIMDQS
jgi:hypothetical protein